MFERFYPATFCGMIDDKLRILTDIKRIWGSRVRTIFVQQGCYANDTRILSTYPPADIHLVKIGDLLNYDFSAFLGLRPSLDLAVQATSICE